MNKKNTAKTDGLDTRAKILVEAKKEFLQKGFAGSSLRVLAEKAGFTTGAIYNEFKNKNGIFEALVGDVFERFIALLQHKEEPSYDMKITGLEDITEISHARFTRIVDFFYENWDELKLIICCSKGSSYEHIFDKAIEYMEKVTIQWMKKDNLKITKQTRFFVHVMVTSHFENLKEIFYHNLEKPDALQYAIDFSGYHCAGWKQYWMDLMRN